MTDQPSREERFIAFLEGLQRRGDRGALAALRRGLGKPPGTVLSMAPFVEPWVQSQRERPCYYLVAALFASHPAAERAEPEHQQPTVRPNLGSVFDRIVNAYVRGGTSREDALKRVERRFTALLNAHSEDLPRHLRHAISLARSQAVPVDYVALLRDLRYWDSDDRRVQQRWATSFWGREAAPGTDETDAEVQDEG